MNNNIDDSAEYVDVVNCDNCDEEIILDKQGYFILEKGEEELCWCRPCFEINWRVMRDDGWDCTDFEYAEEESDEEEEKEEEYADADTDTEVKDSIQLTE
jgi:hypothetical protein